MAQTTTLDSRPSWSGGRKPFKATYGKLMMWFFLMSDAFTFGTFLVAYGLTRFRSDMAWADPEAVYTHFPLVYEWFHVDAPLAFVGLMTFILIASSVTMVLAVEAGHRMDRKGVEKYLGWTLIGGVAFLACQGYEWYHFIIGTHGAEGLHGSLHLTDASQSVAQFFAGAEGVFAQIMNGEFAGTIMTIVDGNMVLEASHSSVTLPEMSQLSEILPVQGYESGWDPRYLNIVEGANLTVNQYSQNPSFAGFFFFITGFHGSHVASGVLLNWMVYRQTQNGTLEKRGHYEMVEKVGLYWHFVDLVWVFVFTFFYLV